MKWRSLEESGPGLDARPLCEIFAERKQLIAKYVPPETQAIHAQAIAELKARHLAKGALPVGEGNSFRTSVTTAKWFRPPTCS
jgi:hypothetical protein